MSQNPTQWWESPPGPFLGQLWFVLCSDTKSAHFAEENKDIALRGEIILLLQTSRILVIRCVLPFASKEGPAKIGTTAGRLALMRWQLVKQNGRVRALEHWSPMCSGCKAAKGRQGTGI